MKTNQKYTQFTLIKLYTTKTRWKYWFSCSIISISQSLTRNSIKIYPKKKEKENIEIITEYILSPMRMPEPCFYTQRSNRRTKKKHQRTGKTNLNVIHIETWYDMWTLLVRVVGLCSRTQIRRNFHFSFPFQRKQSLVPFLFCVWNTFLKKYNKIISCRHTLHTTRSGSIYFNFYFPSRRCHPLASTMVNERRKKISVQFNIFDHPSTYLLCL